MAKTKGIGDYIVNLLLAIFILGFVYTIRYWIELLQALFGKKIDLWIINKGSNTHV